MAPVMPHSTSRRSETRFGIETFDYYRGASYATVTQQAYAARFPERLHALVLDSGFPQRNVLDTYFWGVDLPKAWIRVLALTCSRQADCSKAHPDPAAEIADLVKAVQDQPIVGNRSLDIPTVDEATIAGLLGAAVMGGVSAMELLEAAAAAKGGDPQPLILLARDHPIWPIGGGGGNVADWSMASTLRLNASTVHSPGIPPTPQRYGPPSSTRLWPRSRRTPSRRSRTRGGRRPR